MPPHQANIANRQGMGGSTTKASDCKLCKNDRDANQRGVLCPFCLRSMRRGADDARFKNEPAKRKASFLWGSGEYQDAVREHSKRLRLEKESEDQTNAERERRAEGRRLAAEIAAHLSQMAE